MNALQKIQTAQAAAKSIIDNFKATVDSTPSATEARTEELKTMKKDDLIALILNLEAPKADKGIKVEEVAKALMESAECACLTWGDIADLIVTSGLGEKTSAASIASYASKRKDEWNIVGREKLRFSATDLLAAVNG